MHRFPREQFKTLDAQSKHLDWKGVICYLKTCNYPGETLKHTKKKTVPTSESRKNGLDGKKILVCNPKREVERKKSTMDVIAQCI